MQAFFWLVPVSFVILMSILLVKHLVILGRQLQSGEITLFAPKTEAAFETKPMQGSAELVSELAKTNPDQNPMEAPTQTASTQEVVPKTQSESPDLQSDVTPLSETPTGETEEDVAL